jgi:hypothetical protein
MVRWLQNLFRPTHDLAPIVELLRAQVMMLRDENQRLKQLLREFTRL